jgi:serine/threonine protein kinase
LHYRVKSIVGAGGMGKVYRATDNKLGRDVALKVLPPEMALDPDRLTRFRREARAVAALNDPHIVTIFSVEEAEGVHFLTMELVEGESLDRRIPTGGLPIAQILLIAGALANALAVAHEKGIIHRDVKPANVMITADGRIKVLDFGLAKEARAANADDRTRTSAQTQVGIVMGTPAYMSPEQISGREVDHRTDIFSLGVLLHEISTGTRPFADKSGAELSSAILRDDPALVTDQRADLPADLARIIRRCQEKDPGNRPQTARDVEHQLRDLARQLSPNSGPANPAPSRPARTIESGATHAGEGFRVAVLPFTCKGANSGLEALAEGMTEEIITGLSRFSYLTVISRTASSLFGSGSADAGFAAKELGARYVMEGGVRQAGNQLRVAVKLVDTNTGSHLWAESYERTFATEAIFQLQDDLVPRIVSTVADGYGILPQSMSDAVRSRDPRHLTPYEALLRSLGFFFRLTPDEHAAARTCLERAVQQSPGYADAWAALSLAYSDEYALDFNLQADALGRALRAARHAADIDPFNAPPAVPWPASCFFKRSSRPSTSQQNVQWTSTL